MTSALMNDRCAVTFRHWGLPAVQSALVGWLVEHNTIVRNYFAFFQALPSQVSIFEPFIQVWTSLRKTCCKSLKNVFILPFCIFQDYFGNRMSISLSGHGSDSSKEIQLCNVALHFPLCLCFCVRNQCYNVMFVRFWSECSCFLSRTFIPSLICQAKRSWWQNNPFNISPVDCWCACV